MPQSENESEIGKARERLLAAIKGQQATDILQISYAAYVNGIFQTARTDALCELWLNAPNETWDREDALNAAFARAMNKISEAMESANTRIKPASAGILAKAN